MQVAFAGGLHVTDVQIRALSRKALLASSWPSVIQAIRHKAYF